MTYTQTAWSLEDLFKGYDSPDMQAAQQKVEALAADFETLRAQLSEDMPADAFMAAMRQLEAIHRLIYRIYYYATLRFAADTQNQAAQTAVAQAQQMYANLENRTLFFSLWWKALDDAAAERLMAASGDDRYWLEKLRHFKPHTLSEAEEKIINIKDTTGASALQSLYSTLTGRYTFKLQIDGEEKELTQGELVSYVRHYDPELRARAYQELWRVYEQDAPILGQIYQSLVQDWHNEQVTLRHFAAPIAARNRINDIPDEVVDTLLDVCERNVGVFQRYFKLKARWLNLERLNRYDLYAPLAKSDKRYDFSASADLVLDAFSQFDPQMETLARRVFASQHLDSEVRRGKRSGAFCATAGPDLTPWVHLNYQGQAQDIATLAHELGHAIHSMLAEKHSLFTQHPTLPLAETASTFGEMLLVDRLLAAESDPSVQRDILFGQVDDAYATIGRQAFFAMFERQAHDLFVKGASLDEIAAVYLENLRRQFGDAVEVSDDFRWEWVYVPHFYQTPFYVYAYAFGQLLVLSLYRQFKEEGETFKPRYLRLLAAGGSASPKSILEQAGIDIYSAEFWQGGFDVIQERIQQLEALPVEMIA